MNITELKIKTSNRNELIDITPQIIDFIKKETILNSKLTLFVPHTTAAVTINENADPDVKTDLIFSLNKISPILKEFKHLEGNSDAHVKSSLVGCSQDVIVKNGELLLGIWQSIYFCEFDGPRNRKIYLCF